MENIHHSIDYIEIYVTDMEKAKQFYSLAFGWKFNDYSPSYVGIQKKNGGAEAGGLCLQDKVSTGGPLVVLYSNDLESSLKQVVVAGGSISQESYEFPGGRRFHFKDPSGNELSVWTKT